MGHKRRYWLYAPRFQAVSRAEISDSKHALQPSPVACACCSCRKSVKRRQSKDDDYLDRNSGEKIRSGIMTLVLVLWIRNVCL